MKRAIALLLAVFMCFALCGCGKSEEAQKADDLITAIGQVTAESEIKIIAAEEAVAALSDKDRKSLENADALNSARSSYDAIIEEQNKKLISEVEELITAIGDVGLNSQGAIDAAGAAYDTLSSELQARVSNYNALNTAVTALFDARVADIEQAIDAIGTVSLDSRADIDMAQSIYDAYDADIQAAVGNFSELVEAGETFVALQAGAVAELIDAIGSVTLDSRAAIEDARNAFDALESDVAANVENLSTLESAEEALESLIIVEGEKAIAKLNATEDKVQGITWYESPQKPYYADTRSYVLPYIGQNSTLTWLRLIYHYTGDDWIFWTKLTIMIDGERQYRVFSYYDVERDNEYGNVWEYVDVEPDSADVEMLREIAASEETIIRFEGDNYHYDLTVSSEDKQAISDVLNAFEAMSR